MKLPKQFVVVIGALVGIAAIVMITTQMQVEDGPYNSRANPEKDIKIAIGSMEQDKHLLVVFGANWCADCRKLETMFSQPEFSEFLNAKFEIVHVDVGQFDHNLDTAERLGNPISQGIPALAILDNSGNIINVTKAPKFASIRKTNEGSVQQYLESVLSSLNP